MINQSFFFDRIRRELFDGALKQGTVTGIAGILDAWQREYAAHDDRWLAYMLGTVHHETDRRFRPIKEYGGVKYYTRRYDMTGERPDLAKQNGNTTPGDGARYCGRGFVQLTWKNNYQAMGEVCGVDLVADPDLALQLPIATKILLYGMEKGSFTTKKLADYFAPGVDDWVGARRIINGKDKANLVADYAKHYYAAISYTV